MIVEPIDSSENDFSSEYSVLENLSIKCKKPHSHQTQPYDPNQAGEQSFDSKPDPNSDKFLPNLQQNKTQILYGHLTERFKEITVIPPKTGSNCEPDKRKTFTGKLCLRMNNCLLITSFREHLVNPLNSPETICPRIFQWILSSNFSTFVKEDFYWEAVCDDEEHFDHHNPQPRFDESPQFSQDELNQNLPRLLFSYLPSPLLASSMECRDFSSVKKPSW